MNLVEVIIALLLISLGLTFFVKEEMKIRFSMEDLYFQSVALYQTLSIRERLRLNHEPEFQFQEIRAWNLENAELLPNGKGEVHHDQRFYDISISWEQKKLHHVHTQLSL